MNSKIGGQQRVPPALLLPGSLLSSRRYLALTNTPPPEDSSVSHVLFHAARQETRLEDEVSICRRFQAGSATSLFRSTGVHQRLLTHPFSRTPPARDRRPGDCTFATLPD